MCVCLRERGCVCVCENCMHLYHLWYPCVGCFVLFLSFFVLFLFFRRYVKENVHFYAHKNIFVINSCEQ